MKRLLLYAALCAIPPLAATQALAGPPARPGWELAFSDDFDKPLLDSKRWNRTDPWGLERNHELQAYVEDAFEVKDGILRIKAQKRSADYSGKRRAYTSGMLTTYRKFSQRYGRFEIRCRVPKGQGLWPAFWLLPEPLGWPPEIDVLEVRGQETNKVYMTNHWGSQRHHQQEGGSWAGPDFAADFHVFALEWYPNRLLWFVDDVERFRTTQQVPRQKMYLLVNLAIGGDFLGNPDASTPFPSSLDVDYVRVYRKAAR
jgi:beta-glucanase (GH16 family)